MHTLFERFLEGESEYDACERYWRDIVDGIAISLGQAGEWQPWIPRHFTNGTPMERDGNPMIDGRSKLENRAFRVLQEYPPDGEKIEIAAWLTVMEEEFWDTMPASELVMTLSLTEESVGLAQSMLRLWMTIGTTPEVEVMEAFIRETLPS